MSTDINVKRGHSNTTWAIGSKYEYMCSFKSTYMALSESKNNSAVGEYITKITKLFFIRYPRSLPYDKDISNPDTLIWPDDSMLPLYDTEINSLSDEEHWEHKKAFKLHRKVCCRFTRHLSVQDLFLFVHRECSIGSATMLTRNLVRTRTPHSRSSTLPHP